LLAAKCIGKLWLVSSVYRQHLHDLFREYAIKQTNLDLQKIASLLAEAERRKSNAEYILVQLFEADVDSLLDQNQSILVTTLISTCHSNYCEEITIAGTLPRKQTQAALIALNFLRKILQKQFH
jgi:hypothetical protein